MKTKFFLFSKTILGILIAAFAYFFKYLFPDQDMPEDVRNWLVAFGLGLAGYGRFVADGKLTIFGVGGGAEGSVQPTDRNRRTPKL